MNTDKKFTLNIRGFPVFYIYIGDWFKIITCKYKLGEPEYQPVS